MQKSAKIPKNAKLEFCEKFIEDQKFNIKNQPEMREKCARCHGNHGTCDYEVPGTRVRGCADDPASPKCEKFKKCDFTPKMRKKVKTEYGQAYRIRVQ